MNLKTPTQQIPRKMEGLQRNGLEFEDKILERESAALKVNSCFSLPKDLPPPTPHCPALGHTNTKSPFSAALGTQMVPISQCLVGKTENQNIPADPHMARSSLGVNPRSSADFSGAGPHFPPALPQWS